MKTCSKCKTEKTVSDFHKKGDSFTSQCKVCRKEHADSVRGQTIKQQKKHRDDNKELCQKRKRDYYQKNRDSELVKMKEYRNSNKEKIAIQQKQWREDNKEKKALMDKTYREMNREKINANTKQWKKNRVQTIESKASEIAVAQRRRKSIRDSSDGTVTSRFLTKLFKEQEGKCYHCGIVLDLHKKRAIHLDHLVPIVKGGEHTASNVRWSCAFCNLSKGAKLN